MKYLICLLFSFATAKAVAQDTLTLMNPSFELDKAQHSVTPSHWINLVDTVETPPDIQPGSFKVTKRAKDGKKYLGLVVRDNNTWEAVGQHLNGWLRKDSTYTFSVYLMRSDVFWSKSRVTGEVAEYIAPVVLKIWGVNTSTKKEELLATSLPVRNTRWIQYMFKLNPTVADFDEIDLVAYYTPGFEKRNGNLMIDGCSPIIKIKSKN